MFAPQGGVCVVCRRPYGKGAVVRIMRSSSVDSPLVRLRHDGCDPRSSRVSPEVGNAPLPRRQ